MKVIMVLILFAFGNRFIAQDIEIVEPTKITKVKKDDTLKIKWKQNIDTKTTVNKEVKIELLPIVGNDIKIISEKTKSPNEEGFPWKTDVEKGKYRIRITDIESAANTKTSDEFEVDVGDDNNSKSDENEKSISSIFVDLYGKLEEYLRFKDSPNKSQNEIKKKELEVKGLFFKDISTLEGKIVSVTNKKEKEYYENELKTLKNRFERIDNKTFVRLSLIGDAGLLNSNSTDDKSFAGNGSIGIKFQSETKQFEAKALIVLLSTPDTIKVKYNSMGQVSNFEDFGRSIVNPFSGAKSIQSGYLEFREYFSKPIYGKNPNFGLVGYVGFSNRLWEYSENDTGNPKTKQITANILGASAGLFWDPFSRYLTPLADLKLLINVSGTMRLLYGEVRGDEQFRRNVLGTDTKDFFGIELGFQLVYKGFQAYVTLPAIFSSSGVKGLTNGQYTGGISITTSIFDFEIFNEPGNK